MSLDPPHSVGQAPTAADVLREESVTSMATILLSQQAPPRQRPPIQQQNKEDKTKRRILSNLSK